MSTIKALERKPLIPKDKRVAAYCRVSTDEDKQLHSLSAQISFYSDLIQKTPGWEYAGVYSDEGISGRSTDRAGFQNLIAACEKGQIDIVLVKSISRFARNTVDLLETIRRLKDLDVEVRFERERINTFTADGELLITLLASFAQAESESLGQNVRWGIQKKYREGISHCHRTYGYRWKDGVPEIFEDEAEAVRRTFKYYLEGLSPRKIAERLTAEGFLRSDGEKHTKSSIEYILGQKKYTGDELLQKYFCHPLLHRRVLNQGEFPMYLVKGSLPQIISRETFDEVHRIMSESRYVGGHEHAGFKTSCFSRKLVCGKCGRNFNRAYIGNNRTRPGWRCRGYYYYKDCENKFFHENEIVGMITEAMGTGSFDEELFVATVEKVVIHDEAAQIIYRENHNGEGNHNNTAD